MSRRQTADVQAKRAARADIDRRTPLRLDVAADVAFPFGGGMTAAGLRKEAARGNLTIMRIAGKDFVTLEAIEEMLSRCRITGKTKAKNQSGPSETDDIDIALASALLTLQGLKD